MIEPFLTLEELKELGLYPEDFDESLAPGRYYRYKTLIASGLKKKVFVAYGLRRMGKTYALIKLGELSERYGYKFLYYEMKTLDEYFIPYRNAGKIGKRLVDEIKSGKKFFIVLDEAFNVPIVSLRSFFSPFSKLDRGFIIGLSGSYTYDLAALRAEISRIFFNAKERILELTMPRLRRSKKLKERLPIVDLISPEIRIPRFFILNHEYLLKIKAIEEDGTIKESVRRLLEISSSSGGVPEVMKGKVELKEAISTIVEILHNSFSADVAYYKEKIDRSIVSERPSTDDLIEFFSKIFRKHGSDINVHDIVAKVALSTGLILPRRYIYSPSPDTFAAEIIDCLRRKLPLDLLSKAYPVPSSVLSIKILETLGAKMPYTGIINESFTAHALLEMIVKYSEVDTLIRRLPIFSTRHIDFVLPVEGTTYMIEVKSSLSDIESIIRSFEMASKLGGLFVLLVPARELNYKVPIYKILHVSSTSNVSPFLYIKESSYVEEPEPGIRVVYQMANAEIKGLITNLPREFSEQISEYIEKLQSVPVILPLEVFSYAISRFSLMLSLLLFYALISLGYLLERRYSIERPLMLALLYFFLPALILQVISRNVRLFLSRLPLVLALLSLDIVVSYFFGSLLLRGYEERKRATLLLTSVRPNALFLPLAISIALGLPDSAIVVIFAFSLAFNLLQPIATPLIVSRSSENVLLRALKLPTLRSAVIALLLGLLGIEIALPFYDLFKIGVSYGSFIYVGVRLTRSPKPSEEVLRVGIARFLSPILLRPLILGYGFPMNYVLAIELSSAPAVNNVIYSRYFSLEPEEASRVVTYLNALGVLIDFFLYIVFSGAAGI